MREQAQEWIPEAIDVGDDDGLGVTPELHPGELLDQLLQCADAARERDERVRALEHEPFALVHVVGDDQLVDVAHHPLLLGEEGRNDADDAAAAFERGARHLSHEPEAAAAVDEADAVLAPAPAPSVRAAAA